MQKIWNFVVHNCIVIFFTLNQITESLKTQVTNYMNKEVTPNPKTQTVEKIGILKILHNKTLNTKFILNPTPFTLTLNQNFQP